MAFLKQKWKKGTNLVIVKGKWETEGLFEAKRGSSSPINAISFEKATKMEAPKIVKKQTFER